MPSQQSYHSTWQRKIGRRTMASNWQSLIKHKATINTKRELPICGHEAAATKIRERLGEDYKKDKIFALPPFVSQHSVSQPSTPSSSSMASASLLKSSPVFDKFEWVKGQSLRQPSVSVVRFHPTAAPSTTLTVRAGSYADELVKTAVRISFIVLCFY